MIKYLKFFQVLIYKILFISKKKNLSEWEVYVIYPSNKHRKLFNLSKPRWLRIYNLFTVSKMSIIL